MVRDLSETDPGAEQPRKLLTIAHVIFPSDANPIRKICAFVANPIRIHIVNATLRPLLTPI